MERDGGEEARRLAEGVVRRRASVRPWETAPERYPLAGEILDHATGLIVHSRYTERGAREEGYRGRIWRIPLAAAPVPGVEPARIEGSPVIGSFGHVNPAKRIPQLLSAFAQRPRDAPRRQARARGGDRAGLRARPADRRPRPRGRCCQRRLRRRPAVVGADGRVRRHRLAARADDGGDLGSGAAGARARQAARRQRSRLVRRAARRGRRGTSRSAGRRSTCSPPSLEELAARRGPAPPRGRGRRRVRRRRARPRARGRAVPRRARVGRRRRARSPMRSLAEIAQAAAEVEIGADSPELAAIARELRESEHRLRIAFDVSPLSHAPRTGVPNYILGVAARARRGRRRRARDRPLRAGEPARAGGTWRRRSTGSACGAASAGCRSRTPGARPGARPARPPVERFLGPFDVLHFWDWMYPPQRAGVRATMIHDLVPLRHPEWTTPRTRAMHTAKYRNAAATCDVVFVNSTYTGPRRRRAAARARRSGSSWRRPASPRASGRTGSAPTWDGRTSSPSPRSSRGRTWRRCSPRIALLELDVLLAVAGPPGMGPERRAGERDGVRGLGYVDDDELARLYRGRGGLRLPGAVRGLRHPRRRGDGERHARGGLLASLAGRRVRGRGRPRRSRLARGDRRGHRRGDLAPRASSSTRGLEHARRFTWEETGRAFLDGYLKHSKRCGSGSTSPPLALTRAGTARYLQELLPRLHQRVELVQLAFGGPGRVTAAVRDAAWYPLGLPRRARRAGIDVLHCPTFRAPFRAARSARRHRLRPRDPALPGGVQPLDAHLQPRCSSRASCARPPG